MEVLNRGSEGVFLERLIAYEEKCRKEQVSEELWLYEEKLKLHKKYNIPMTKEMN